MIYVAHTAHWQFLGLVVGFLAWILTMVAAGINEWRLWDVADVSVVTSGVAWVGIWRACFYSHALPETETCRSISISNDFVPAEIPIAQVFMMLAVISGLAGNISAAAAVRMVYFSLEDRRKIRVVFVTSGVLYLLTATFSLVPLVWNLNSVLSNSTIDFPPEFHLPAAPLRQKVGSAIGMGLFAAILTLFSGVTFLCYRYRAPEQTRDQLNGPWTATTLTQNSSQGRDNQAFHRVDDS